MKYKISYECADGNNQVDEKDCSLSEAIEYAMEMVRSDEGDSTMTWSVEDEAGETVASGAGNAQDE